MYAAWEKGLVGWQGYVCMTVCMYIWVHVCMYAAHMHAGIRICVCMHDCVNDCLHTLACVAMHACVHVWIVLVIRLVWHGTRTPNNTQLIAKVASSQR